MNKHYYVTVNVFDTFEGTSTIIRKFVIASDEDEAKKFINEIMDKEIEASEAPCVGYEIISIEVK